MTTVTVPSTRPMTAREYLDLPESELERPCNLIDGEVVATDATWTHQRTTVRVLVAIASWVNAGEGRGAVTTPIDVYLDDRNVYTPDVVWYSEARIPSDPDARPLELPDVAVEVRSPATWRHDVGAKKHRYERAGLPELWLVDGHVRTVLVFRRSSPEAPAFDVALELSRDEGLDSPLMPGFATPVSRLFD